MENHLRNRMLFAIGLFVAALFLWLALRETRFDVIADNLKAANPKIGVPFIAILFLFYWLKSDRWRILLSPVTASATKDLFPIVMIGYAGSAILPMQLGELIRTLIASRKFSIPFSTTLASITVERLFDLLIVLLILGLVLASGLQTSGDLAMASYIIAAICLTFAIGMVLLVTNTDSIIEAVLRVLPFLPQPIADSIRHHLTAASAGLLVLKSLSSIWRIFVSSIFQWLLMATCIFLSFEAVGLDLSVLPALTVLAFTVIAVTLPTSPGYIGSIQFAFVLGLGPFGVAPDMAIAASIFYHVLAYVSVLVTGFAFLHRYGYTMAEVKSDAESLDSGENSG